MSQWKKYITETDETDGTEGYTEEQIDKIMEGDRKEIEEYGDLKNLSNFELIKKFRNYSEKLRYNWKNYNKYNIIYMCAYLEEIETEFNKRVTIK